MTSLEHFGSEGDDLHEVPPPQFPSYRTKNTGPDGLMFLIQDHRRVGVEADQRTIGTLNGVSRSDDHRPGDLPFFDPTVR